MTLDLNDPELEFSDLVYAYQSWVMAVINDEKLEGDDLLLTDCLLYTSPSPRDRQKSRMPSSA